MAAYPLRPIEDPFWATFRVTPEADSLIPFVGESLRAVEEMLVVVLRATGRPTFRLEGSCRTQHASMQQLRTRLATNAYS